MNSTNENINTIKCIAINVNFIINTERQHFLNSFLKEHNPDIMLLSETKLNSK